MSLPSEVPVVLKFTNDSVAIRDRSEPGVLQETFEDHAKVRMLLGRRVLVLLAPVRPSVLPLFVAPRTEGLREFLALTEDPNRRQDDPNPFFVLYITKGLSASDGILEPDLYGVSASFRLGIPHLPMPAGAHSSFLEP